MDNTSVKMLIGKEWSTPELYILSVKDTENGTPFSTKEDTDAFDPTQSP